MDFPSNGCTMVQARDKPPGRLGSDSQVLCKELCFDSIHEPAFTSLSPCSGFQASRHTLKCMSLNGVSPCRSQTVMKSKLKNMLSKAPTPQDKCGSYVFFLQEELSFQVILYSKMRNLKSLPNGIHQSLGRDKRWELLCLQGGDCNFQAYSAPERWKFLLCTDVMYSFEHMEGGSFFPL